ncbi:hypothetical protein [Bacteriophage sp.]|nr:hypothetical protein [Bacteriophage sp.]
MLRDIFTRERKLFLNRIGKSKPARPTRDDLISALLLMFLIGFLLFGFAALAYL